MCRDRGLGEGCPGEHGPGGEDRGRPGAHTWRADHVVGHAARPPRGLPIAPALGRSAGAVLVADVSPTQSEAGRGEFGECWRAVEMVDNYKAKTTPVQIIRRRPDGSEELGHT